MTTFATTLEAREEIAEGTMAFHLRKPSGFNFKPGQAIDVILTLEVSAPQDQSTRHTFSIVSAPFQDDLVIATRMRDSAYKRALKSMTVGSPVAIDGPSGSLGLHKDPARAAILIAGGIGITPFMSMLRQAAKVTAELVRHAVGDLSAPIFYVAGPPGMVEAMRQTLSGAGIDDDDIRSEEFYGY